MKNSSNFYKTVAVLIFIFNCTFIFSQQHEIQSRLDCVFNINDEITRNTLKNNVLIGNYTDIQELKNVIESNREIEWNIDISEAAEKIYSLDHGRVEDVKINEHKSRKLFSPINEDLIPESYFWTIELCNKFNPARNTNDHRRLKKDIDEYLSRIEELPVIQYALEVTGTSMQDFRRNWFGSGRGFEHIIAGETKGSKVSGYHWWYKFYEDERKNDAVYQKSLEGMSDGDIFTGKFTWDPEGPVNKCYKKKGGFAIKESAAAMLALGHIAIEAGKSSGIRKTRMRFWANINGRNYLWCMYTQNGTIRTMYPMANNHYFFPIED